jgi:hypothetical protein
MRSEDHAMRAPEWLLWRFIPVLGLSAAFGVVVGILRGGMPFLPGIQGMAIGLATGYAAGWLGRNDSPEYLSVGQRFFFGIAAACVFTSATLLTMGFMQAAPFEGPLEWLGEVSSGFIREPFYGVGNFRNYSGMLTGGWWRGFTFLDSGLYVFLFLVGAIAGIPRGNVPATDGSVAPEDDGGDDSDGAPREKTRVALGGLVGVLLLLGAGFVVLNAYEDAGSHVSLSPDTLKIIRPLVGRWILKDPAGVIRGTDEDRMFDLRLGGFDSLRGISVLPGRFAIDFTWWGGHYRGKIWLSGRTMPLWVRMRPDEGNNSLRIVLFMYGNGRRIVEMRAERVPK